MDAIRRDPPLTRPRQAPNADNVVSAVIVSLAGKLVLKCMICAENGGRGRDCWLVFESFIENVGAGAETGFDLGEGMVPSGLRATRDMSCIAAASERNPEKSTGYVNCGSKFQSSPPVVRRSRAGRGQSALERQS